MPRAHWHGPQLDLVPSDSVLTIGIPILILLACFTVGVVAAAKRLPRLSPEPVDRLAFATVCVLVGASLSAFGLTIYTTVREVEHSR
jgi:uncharacterized BrkB/YihY/UPF0761 family membrane protein